MSRRGRLLLVVALAAATSASVFSIAGGNQVPPTRLGEDARSIGPNDVKPLECAGVDVTNIVTGALVITGTLGNDLVLGSEVADTIEGLAGADCIVAGGGDDLIDGGPGTDVCIGGPGNDTFVTVLGIHTCETRIQ